MKIVRDQERKTYAKENNKLFIIKMVKIMEKLISQAEKVEKPKKYVNYHAQQAKYDSIVGRIKTPGEFVSDEEKDWAKEYINV